jgi:hypothetical protein
MSDETWEEHASFIDAQRAEFDHDELQAERALADDLAAALVQASDDIVELIDAVLARYREARR